MVQFPARVLQAGFGVLKFEVRELFKDLLGWQWRSFKQKVAEKTERMFLPSDLAVLSRLPHTGLVTAAGVIICFFSPRLLWCAPTS